MPAKLWHVHVHLRLSVLHQERLFKHRRIPIVGLFLASTLPTLCCDEPARSAAR